MNIKSNSTSVDKQDEAFFEQYLQGESPLSKVYKKTDSAEPSDELDQIILNAAKTSIEQNASTHAVESKNWPHSLSWAASIAIFSLVGLLTLSTWQAEQENLEQELLKPQTISEEQDLLSPESSEKKRNKPLGQAKQTIPQEVNNDSRKLLYKNEVVPEMQAAPAYMRSRPINTLSKSKSSVLNAPKSQKIEATNTSTPSTISVADEVIEEKQSIDGAPQKQGFTYSTEQEIWLDKIRLLIKQNKLDEAHELMHQFRIKYPDYTIDDPVILPSLAPY